jgi:hypothetical protein
MSRHVTEYRVTWLELINGRWQRVSSDTTEWSDIGQGVEHRFAGRDDVKGLKIERRKIAIKVLEPWREVEK